VAEVGEAYLSILPSFKGGSKKIAEQLDGKGVGRQVGTDVGSGISSVAKKAFAPLAAALSVAAVGSFVKGAIDAAGDLEQSVGAVDSVFRDSAGSIHDWAQTSAEAVGLSADAYSSSASVIGAMLTNYGVASDKVAASTNDLIRYGADLSAMFGGTTEEAVSALGAALRGEADPAERFGLSLSKAKVEAHMAATGIKSSTEATLDLIKTQITASGAMGQFAREGDTLQGAQQRLAAGWTNIQASIGQLFLPAAASAVGALSGMLPAIQSVIDGLGGLKTLLVEGDFTSALSDGLHIEEDSAITEFVLNLGEAFRDAGGGFDGLLAAANEAFWSVVEWMSTGGIGEIADAILSGRERLFSAGMEIFPALLDAVMDALPEVVEWITQTMLPQIISAITTLIPALATGLTGLVSQIASMLTTLLPTLLSAATTLFTSLVTALLTILPTVIDTLLGILPSLIETLLGMLPTLLETALTLFLSIVDAVLQALPQILMAVLDMLPSLIETLLNMLPRLLETAIDLFLSLVDAVVTVLPELITMLLGTVLPKLLDTVLNMLPRLLETAIDLFLSLVTAVAKALPKILAAVVGILPQLVTTIVGLVPKLIPAAIELFLSLVEGIAKALPDIVKALVGMGPDFIKALTSINLADAGRQILDGFLNGLKKGFEKVKDFVGGIGSWIADHKGPKRYDLALLVPAGGWIMQGLGEGIEGQLPALRSSLGRVTSEIEGGIGAATSANLGLVGSGPSSNANVSGDTYNLSITVDPSRLRSMAELEAWVSDVRRLARQKAGV